MQLANIQIWRSRTFYQTVWSALASLFIAPTPFHLSIFCNNRCSCKRQLASDFNARNFLSIVDCSHCQLDGDTAITKFGEIRIFPMRTQGYWTFSGIGRLILRRIVHICYTFMYMYIANCHCRCKCKINLAEYKPSRYSWHSKYIGVIYRTIYTTIQTSVIYLMTEHFTRTIAEVLHLLCNGYIYHDKPSNTLMG